MKDQDIWRGIPGYVGRYQASMFGDIRSIMTGEFKPCKQHDNRTKYPYKIVGLTKHGERVTMKLVGRLVWETFNGPIPKGKVIAYKDGDRTNNALSNLLCLTRGEAQSHSYFIREIDKTSPEKGIERLKERERKIKEALDRTRRAIREAEKREHNRFQS